MLRASSFPDRVGPFMLLPEALPDRLGRFMLDEDVLAVRDSPLLLRDGTLPRRPLLLLAGGWSWCWRSQALTSIRLRGVVRSAEAREGTERLLRMLVRRLPAASGASSPPSVCVPGRRCTPGRQHPPSGPLYPPQGHRALWPCPGCSQAFVRQFLLIEAYMPIHSSV